MSNQGCIDVIYTEFTKAFDKIVQIILISDLQNYSFKWEVMKYFEPYFEKRSDYTYNYGCKKDNCVVVSGVTQVPNIWPLLFNLS